MADPPSAPSPRLVTLDLDQLYRDRAELEDAIARDRRTLAGLEGAIAVVEERLGIAAREATRPGNVVTARKSRPTHRAMLLQVLADAKEPLGVRQLIDGVRDQFGETIPRTSVSPLLRKLAGRSEVVHVAEKSKWSIGSEAKPAAGEIVKMRSPSSSKRESA